MLNKDRFAKRLRTEYYQQKHFSLLSFSESNERSFIFIPNLWIYLKNVTISRP